MFKNKFFNGHVLPYLVDLEHKVWLHERWAVSWRLTLHFSIWYLESCCVLQCSGDLEDKVWLHEHWTVPLRLTSFFQAFQHLLFFNFFFTFHILQLYCPNGIFSMGNSGCFPPWKPAAKVVLPKLQCMLGVLVFPWSIELWHGLQDL